MGDEGSSSDWAEILQYPVVFNLGVDGTQTSYADTVVGHQIPTSPLTSYHPQPEKHLQAHEYPFSSYSTTFHPNFSHQSRVSDLGIVSSDKVCFHVHMQTLMESSDNQFLAFFPNLDNDYEQWTVSALTHVCDKADVLNVILHAIYNISCVRFTPSSQTLYTTVTRLAAYGVSAKSIISPASHLHTHLLHYAARHPLPLYALAASCDIHALAVETSPHLLSCDLSLISDELTAFMGPVYLRRLYFLQLGRKDALQRILKQPFCPAPDCPLSDQKKFLRAFKLASAYFVWEGKPDLTSTVLKQTFGELAAHVECSTCRHGLLSWTKDVVDEWLMVKRTIA